MKTIDELYAEMRAAFAEETGVQLNEGGELAVRLYTLASQLYGLYVQNEWTLAQCFPQTARGTHLDNHAFLRGLQRNEPTKARGKLLFSLAEQKEEAVTIPAGTVCMTAALTAFATTEEGVIAPGALSAEVSAEAKEPGTGGNVAAGTVRTMTVAPVGVASCTNPLPFSGGRAEEEDEALRARVLDSFLRMPNGANAAYYEREAMAAAKLAAVNVLGRNRGPGTVDVVIAEEGGTPSNESLEAVSAHLSALREIAVDLRVLPPTLSDCGVSVLVEVEPGRTPEPVLEAVSHALGSYFDGSLLGKAVLQARLGQIIFGVEGVVNYRILAPASDLPATPGVLYRLSGLTVEAM